MGFLSGFNSQDLLCAILSIIGRLRLTSRGEERTYVISSERMRMGVGMTDNGGSLGAETTGDGREIDCSIGGGSTLGSVDICRCCL